MSAHPNILCCNIVGFGSTKNLFGSIRTLCIQQIDETITKTPSLLDFPLTEFLQRSTILDAHVKSKAESVATIVTRRYIEEDTDNALKIFVERISGRCLKMIPTET